MARTLHLIEYLRNGARDSSGAVIASGKARFYDVGTTTPQTVWADKDGSSAISAPLTLDAGGRGVVYHRYATRIIIKDSTDTTTLIDETFGIARDDQVYITHPNVNGGNETTLYNYLGDVTGTTAGISTYLESSTATTRTIASRLGDIVSAKDYGAVGDDSNDDTASLQAFFDRLAGSDKIGIIPAGTYKLTAGLSVAAGAFVCFGAGIGSTVLKQYSTSASTFSFAFGAQADANVLFRDLTISASTTTSGAAITSTNADRIVCQGVMTKLHRQGFDLDGSNFSTLVNCRVDSTDSNAASIGIDLGADCRAIGCRVIAANGTGIKATGARTQLTDCWAQASSGTAFNLVGNDANAAGIRVEGASTTGIASSGTSHVIERFQILGNTTTGVNSSGTAAVIRSGQITGTTTTGVLCSATRATVTDVNVVGNTTTGISMTAAQARVIDCRVIGTSTTGVSLSAVGGVARGVGIHGAASTAGVTLSANNCVASDVTIDAACGKAINITGLDCTARDVQSTAASTTGVYLGGDRARAIGCTVAAGTTGIDIADADCMAAFNSVTNTTTGITVGAVADAKVVFNWADGNTTDISINASATNYEEFCNGITVLTDTADLSSKWLSRRRYYESVSETNDNNAAVSWTPVITGNVSINVLDAGNALTGVTVNATSTTGLRQFDKLVLFVHESSGGTAGHTITWNAQYENWNSGIALPASANPFGFGTSPRGWRAEFIWEGETAASAVWKLVSWECIL